MLLLPALVALYLPAAVADQYPGTREVPALCSVLSLLSLKSIGRRRSVTSTTCASIQLSPRSRGSNRCRRPAPCAATATISLSLMTRSCSPRWLSMTGRVRPAAPISICTFTLSCTSATTSPFKLTTFRCALSVPKLSSRSSCPTPNPQPALRQRHLHQSLPSLPGDLVLPSLSNLHRSPTRVAGVLLQGHHQRLPLRTVRRRAYFITLRARIPKPPANSRRSLTVHVHPSPSTAAALTTNLRSTSSTSPSVAARYLYAPSSRSGPPTTAARTPSSGRCWTRR